MSFPFTFLLLLSYRFSLPLSKSFLFFSFPILKSFLLFLLLKPFLFSFPLFQVDDKKSRKVTSLKEEKNNIKKIKEAKRIFEKERNEETKKEWNKEKENTKRTKAQIFIINR